MHAPLRTTPQSGSGLANWRSSFPSALIPRQLQADALDVLAESWSEYDVFVIVAPTAFGKTEFAETLCNTLYGVSVVVPTNQLVEQHLARYPARRSLHRMDSYWCSTYECPSLVTRARRKGYCREPGCLGCKQISRDVATAKYQRGPGVYNYHTYLAHKIHRPVLVVDEAHTLLPVLKERFSVRIWQHVAKYPTQATTAEHLRTWLSGLPPKKRRSKQMEALDGALNSLRPEYTWVRTRADYNGAGTLRGQPESRDCLELTPVDIRGQPPLLWPGLGRPGGQVQKVVLLSATISRKDVEELGLRGRVCYIDCASPIPVERRPTVLHTHLTVNRGTQDYVIPELLDYLGGLAQDHEGEKGLVHATYGMAAQIRSTVQGMAGTPLGTYLSSRLVYHDRSDKQLRYQEWRASAPAAGKVLVASGMYEGVDLAGDAARWQVLTKVPWPSLGHPAVAYQAEQDPEWYAWSAAKLVVQSSGRVCRGPEDYGVTYILDRSVHRLLDEIPDLLPPWWLDSLVYPTGGGE